MFPCVLMFLNVCASIRYLAARDVGQGLYWLFAFGLTFCVTFLRK